MKTPKRKKCGLAVLDAVTLTFEQIEAARWKRKNREAQLKRTIARLSRIERRKLRQDKLLNLYRERVSCLKWEIEDARMDIENESTAATAWEKDYYRLLHIAHGYCSASTCGQDIEGS